MFYAFVNRNTKEIVDVQINSIDARKAFDTRENREELYVRPFIREIEYHFHTSEDFKGTVDETPYIVYMDIFTGATHYGPVILADNDYGAWKDVLLSRGAKIRSLISLRAVQTNFSERVDEELLSYIYLYWITEKSREAMREILTANLSNFDFDTIDTFFPPRFNGALFDQWAAYVEKQHKSSQMEQIGSETTLRSLG